MKVRFRRLNRYSTKRLKNNRKLNKQLENEVRNLIISSVTTKETNTELAEKNALLLSEIEAMKKEKVQLFESLVFKRNQNSSANKEELIVLLDSLKEDHKNMIEMFQKCNEFYNQMIDKFSDKIRNLVEAEGEDPNTTLVSNESEERLNTQTMYEMRRQIRKDYLQNALEENGENLSDINEETREVEEVSTLTNTPMTGIESDFRSANSRLSSPALSRVSEDFASYQMTPHFSAHYRRTPSIYLNTLPRDWSQARADRSSFSPYDLTVKELSLTKFQSFDTTLSEERSPLTASTPLNPLPANGMDMRPSRRLSSIAMPYSPRQSPKGRKSLMTRKSLMGRPSLIDIQNIMDNKRGQKKAKKPSALQTTVSDSQLVNSDSMLTISPQRAKAKKRLKKCESSVTLTEAIDTSETSLNSTTQSVRNLRSRKPVSYKEPALNRRLNHK